MSAPEDLTYTEFKKWYRKKYGASTSAETINKEWEKYKNEDFEEEGEKSVESESIEPIERPQVSRAKSIFRKYTFYLRYVEGQKIYLLQDFLEDGEEKLAEKVRKKLVNARRELTFSFSSPIIAIKIASDLNDLLSLDLEVEIEGNTTLDLGRELTNFVETNVSKTLLFQGKIGLKSGFLGYFPTSQFIYVDRGDGDGEVKAFVYQVNPAEYIKKNIDINSELVTANEDETVYQLSKLKINELKDIEYYIFRRLWEDAKDYTPQIIIEIQKSKFFIRVGYEDYENRIANVQEILNVLDSYSASIEINGVEYKIGVLDILDESEEGSVEEPEEEPEEESISFSKGTPPQPKIQQGTQDDVVIFKYIFGVTKNGDRIKDISDKNIKLLENRLVSKIGEIAGGEVREATYTPSDSSISISVKTVRRNRVLVGEQLIAKLEDDNIVKIGNKEYLVNYGPRKTQTPPEKTQLDKLFDKSKKKAEKDVKEKKSPRKSPSKKRTVRHAYRFSVDNPRSGQIFKYIFITVEAVDNEFIEYKDILREEDHKKFDKIFTNAWNVLPDSVQSMNAIEYIDNIYEIEIIAKNDTSSNILKYLRSPLSMPIKTKDGKELSLIIARFGARTPPSKYSTINEEESEEAIGDAYIGLEKEVYETLTKKEKEIVRRKSRSKTRLSFNYNFVDLNKEKNIPNTIFQYVYSYILGEEKDSFPHPYKKKLTKQQAELLKKNYFDVIGKKLNAKNYISISILEVANGFYEITVRGTKDLSYNSVKTSLNKILEKPVEIGDKEINMTTLNINQDSLLESYYYSYSLSEKIENKSELIDILNVITAKENILDRFEYPQIGIICGVRYVDDENIDIYVETTEKKEPDVAEKLDEYLSYINQGENLQYNILPKEEEEGEGEEEEIVEKKKKPSEVSFLYQLAVKGRKNTQGNITGEEEDKATHIITQFETENAFIDEIKIDSDGSVTILTRLNKGVEEEEVKQELDEYLSDKKIKTKKRTLSFIPL